MGVQFDLFEARAERDAGLALVAGNQDDWFTRALRCVEQLPRGWRGIAEDLRPLIEQRVGPPPGSTNVYGALTAAAKRLGYLKPTGLRRQMRLVRSHARVSDEYTR